MSEPVRFLNGSAMAFAVLCHLTLASPAVAQTDIDEQSMQIIDRCLEAMGGEMELSSIESILMTGKSTLAKGGPEPSPVEYVTASGGRFSSGYVDSLMSVSNGTWIWEIKNGEPRFKGPRKSRPALFPHHESVLNWKQFRGKIRTAGEADIDGKRTWKLEFQQDEKTDTLFFDQQSGLLVQTTLGGKSRTWFRFEYRDVGDILVPAKIFIFNGSENDESTLYQTFEYDHIELNPELPAEKFQMPAEVREAMKEKFKKRESPDIDDRYEAACN